MKRTNKKTKAEAITQILILVIGIVAISWMIGGEVRVVDAADNSGTTISCTASICTLGALWGQKSVGGKCVIDYSNKQDCTYGCTEGSSICNSKSGSSGFGQTVSTITTALAIPKGLSETAKLSEGLLGKLGIIAAKTVTLSTGSTVTTAAEAKALLAAGKLSTADKALLTKAFPELATKAGASWLLGGTHGVGQAGYLGVGGYISIVAWSAIAFIMGRYVIGHWLGFNTQQSQALGYALAGGTAAGLSALEIIGTSSGGGLIGLAIGASVAFVMFAILAKKSSVDLIQYTCSQWDSQSGKGLTPTQMTQRCKVCNDQKDLVCTEYQCRSLGQGCVLINDASSGRQLCIWNNTKDINPPVITTWEDALPITKDFKYTPDNTISPPDKGVKITYTGKESVTTDGTTRCAPPFTQLSFGVQLNEPAKCKISPLQISSYAEMADVFMGRGIRDYNQSFSLSLPSKEAMEAENITVENGGKYQLFVRCEDANGNSNVENFVFKFCISQGPDITPPEILGTSILDKQPIASGQKSMEINLYVRDQTFTKENTSCRWSHLDKSYNTMEGNMSCTHSLLDINSQMAYTCKGNLTGLNDNINNKFYFRCIDDAGNANTQSFPLTLIGTQPLTIDKAGPSGIIKDSTNSVKVNLSVETSAGYDEGKAVCSFSETGKPGSYVDFFYGYDEEPFSQYQHSQELWLEARNYTYFIQCTDRGGNMDNTTVSFKVETDTSPPVVVRIYKKENYLKLITDEPATCVYSNFGCNYDMDKDGNAMTTLDDKEHYTDWDITKDYYIKCKDKYENKPPADKTCNTDACRCSIIVSPFEIFAPQ